MVSFEYDAETDVLYVQLAEIGPGEVARTRDLDGRRLIDLDASGRPVGIELLYVSEGVRLDGLPGADAIRAAAGALSALASAA